MPQGPTGGWWASLLRRGWTIVLVLAPLFATAPEPSRAGLAQSIEKSALQRVERAAGAHMVSKTIYRRLPAHIESTFHQRVYAQRVLKQDLIAYRYHSPLNPHHGGYVFLTTEKYLSEKQLRDRLSIPPGSRPEGQHITNVTIYRISKNTLISEGTVAARFGYKGGGYQIVVENPPDAWIVRKQSFKSWRAGQ